MTNNTEQRKTSEQARRGTSLADREAFEEWLKTVPSPIPEMGYEDEARDLALLAWQAALSQREQVGEYDPANEHCPTCGYYCLGKSGIGCIDKPSMLSATRRAIVRAAAEIGKQKE